MATAVEAWEERWATPEGRADWLVPHPAVAVLKARGTQHVLDLGCGVACTHCYSPSTALP
jgi:tellurite methyltransferase